MGILYHFYPIPFKEIALLAGESVSNSKRKKNVRKRKKISTWSIEG
jgi:hypothetical protein